MGFSLLSENLALLKFTASILQKQYGAAGEITAEENRLTKKMQYTLFVDGADDILRETGIVSFDANGLRQINYGIDPYLVSNECCAKTYLKAFFLGAGALEVPVSDGTGGYHLEFDATASETAEGLKALLESFGFPAKITPRKHSFVVYLKDKERISDLLAFFGASRGVMTLQNIILERSVRNLRNRQTNCITNNISKAVDASVKQIRAIEKIRDTRGLESLPEKLRDLAELRLSHPTASMEELVQCSKEPIGKSGINHRFRKILALAEEINKSEADYEKQNH